MAEKTVTYTPQDEEAEAQILAALLTSPEVFADVTESLVGEDFSTLAHQYIFEAIVGVDAKGRPIDTITVGDELKARKHLTKVGGLSYLQGLCERTDVSMNAMAHVAIVRNKALLRNLMSTGREIAGKALDPSSEGAEVLAEAEGLVFALGGKRSPSSLVPMSKAVADTMAELAKVKGRVLLGHSTGFAELDRLTGGFQGGQLITIGARPAMGKTAFALQMAAHIAESTGLCVPFFSYEMGTTELTMRILSSTMHYSLHRLRQGDIPNDFQHDMVKVAERISAWPLMLDDTPPESVSGMRSVARRLARRENVGAIFIDYLQLMESDRGGREMNRTNEITDISRKLKRLASELDVPVIALSQLSRQLESRPNKRPMLSDLRESGSIEQDSSVVLFIYRDHVYNADADPRFGECIVAKQRNGPGGPNVTVPLRWDGECAAFSDVERAHMVAASMDSRAGF